MVTAWAEHIVASLIVAVFLSPIAAFAYGCAKARSCPSWPGRWRIVVVVFYSGCCLLVPYLTFYTQYGLLAWLAFPVVGLIAPVFAVVFVLNANDIAKASQVNLCRYCEYDLTGNVSGICPECGEQVEPREELMGDD